MTLCASQFCHHSWPCASLRGCKNRPTLVSWPCRKTQPNQDWYSKDKFFFVFVSLFQLYILSVPVQSIAWNDSPLKWPVICLLGHKTLLTQLISAHGINMINMLYGAAAISSRTLMSSCDTCLTGYTPSCWHFFQPSRTTVRLLGCLRAKVQLSLLFLVAFSRMKLTVLFAAWSLKNMIPF